jgi:hypothetical protein
MSSEITIEQEMAKRADVFWEQVGRAFHFLFFVFISLLLCAFANIIVYGSVRVPFPSAFALVSLSSMIVSIIFVAMYVFVAFVKYMRECIDVQHNSQKV